MAASLREAHSVQLVPAMLVVLVVAAFEPHLLLLRGLRCYYTAAGAPREAKEAKRVKAAPGRRGGGSAKKEGNKDKEEAGGPDLAGAESLIAARLSVRQAQQLTYLGELTNLVLVPLVVLSVLASTQAFERLLGWPPSPLLSWAAYSLCFVALAMLAKVDLLSGTTDAANKVYAAWWGMCGFAAALTLHVLQPGSGRVLAWDTARAAAAVGPAATEFVQRFGNRLMGGAFREGAAAAPTIVISPFSVQLALAAAAALLAMLLFVPALRFARAYWLQMSPPDWAAEYLSARPLHTATLLLHLLLPVLTSLLWVRPMAQELAGLSDRQLAAAQVAALLATAAGMAANTRTLLQRHLDRSLTGWHQLKHGSRAARSGSAAERRSLGELISLHCQVTNSLLGKVAVQSLAPAVLYLGLGLTLLDSVLRPAEPGSLGAEVQALVQTCVGFLSAWTGTCWFAYSAGMLWLFRTGVMQPL